MKIGVVSVAFRSELFSKVLVESFKKHYPGTVLVLIDNNSEATAETSWLKKQKGIRYIKSGTTIHGEGLDIGFNYLKNKKFDICITLDIDTLILNAGLLPEIQNGLVKGYTYGGRYVDNAYYSGYLRRPKFIHPSCSFYSISEISKLRASFCKAANPDGYRYDTGLKISLTQTSEPFIIDETKYILHFGCGSAFNKGKFVSHLTFAEKKNRKRYLDKWKEFFDRPDVRSYLVSAMEEEIKEQIRIQTNKYFFKNPISINKIGTEAFLVIFMDGKLKVRPSYPEDPKQRGDYFHVPLGIHRTLQKHLPEMPKILKYIEVGKWKFKFIEWVEGENLHAMGVRLKGYRNIPKELFYKLGVFMGKLKKLGVYGQDGQLRHALYRSDMDTVVLCDFGASAFSNKERAEIEFLKKLFVGISKEQQERFYDGYKDQK